MSAPPLHILCLSHLVWERRLFQRPQQLMACFDRLGHHVLYESLMSSRRWLTTPEDREARFGEHGRAVNRPFLPLSGRSVAVNRLSRRGLLSRGADFLNGAPAGRRVLWLQHPAFATLLDRLPHDLLVYDIMDPFESFRRTGADVAEMEAMLLDRADLVFTGGRSLHRQREARRPDAHCFPSGIDFEHFARGADDGPIPDDLQPIKRPILGYFGAVDERIDWPLVRALCTHRPDWNIVFLGPLVMIDRCPVDSPNFHHLGAKDYGTLPDYLRGFDVCLIPWLVNELTCTMSPTKTPEYLAAGRPVVSTPIPDVQSDYGDEVAIAADPEEFAARCEEALATGIGPSRKPPQARTWQETAEAMLALIQGKLEG
ncbi:glycosyltransferase [bacterium]|nr:glycosyltransferase [bacterium]